MFSLLPLAAPHLKAGAWPQDNLKQIWHKSGIPIDYRNRHIISRDYYGLVGQTLPLDSGESSTVTVQVGQDGDFWMTSMSFWSQNHDATIPGQQLPWGSVQITDNSSGYKLFDGGVLISFLTGMLPPNAVVLGGLAAGPEYHPYVRTSLPQPYPMLRDSSMTINIEVFNRISGAPNPVYFVLDGWKEYQNAAGQ